MDGGWSEGPLVIKWKTEKQLTEEYDLMKKQAEELTDWLEELAQEQHSTGAPAMSDKIEKMTDDDFKKIMQQLGMPESKSLYSALKQVENHTWQSARTVPDGFVVVPVEPTQEMLKKSGLYDDDTIEVNCAASMAGQIYRAMLAAAPEVKK